MKIAVISQFFPPEMGAPASRFFDFSRYWLAAGHDMTLFTAFPNFPTGVIPKPYRRKLFMKETHAGITIHRSYIWARPRLSPIDKILGFATFGISASFAAFLRARRFDIVISTSPPPSTSIPGILAARRAGKPFILDVRDLWPESAVQNRRIKSHLLINISEKLEAWMYKSAKLITVVTQGKKERLIERGIPGEKIHVISNGVDMSLFDEEANKPLPEKLEQLISANDFLFTYAGVFNPPQGLDIILNSAGRLRMIRPDLYARSAFLMIGDGSRRNHLEERVKKEGLDRVHFVGVQPRSIVFGIIHRSFANLVTLKKRGDTHTVPSKIYEALASGRPTLISATGESVEIIEKAHGGLASPPEDVVALVANMVQYMEQPEMAMEDGRRGRLYCEQNYDRKKIAGEYESILLQFNGH